MQLKEPTSSVHQHESLRAKLLASNRTINKCDLHIRFPPTVKVTIQDRQGQNTHEIQENGVVDNLGDIEGATPAVMPTPSTPHGESLPNPSEKKPQYKPIAVKIWFKCVKPLYGMRFVNTDGSGYPHAYTVNHPIPCSTSLWLPCLDGLWERCTWEFHVSIPKTIGHIKRRRDKSNGFSNGVSSSSVLSKESKLYTSDEIRDALPMRVICSADEYEEVIHPEDSSRKIISFAQGSPAGASHVGFVVGPFERCNLTDFREVEDDEVMGSSAVEIIGYCLPGRIEELRNTCGFLCKAIDFYVKEFGSYPYATYSICFIEHLEVDAVSLCGLSIIADRHLFEEKAIDPIYTATKQQAVLLANQWVGVNIVPRSWSDLWLIIGLSTYIAGLFLRVLMGNNEYRYRLKQNCIRITELDNGRPPISSRELDIPIDPEQTEFLHLKAPMVLHMLEQRMTKAGSTLGLRRVIPRIFLQALSGELSNGILTTAQFLRQCEKVAHLKLEDFSRQWITGYGFPRFSVVQRYNKKKMVIEMGIRQQQFSDSAKARLDETSFVDDAHRSLTKAAIGPVEAIFTGPITIRVHEADGTPLEHIVDLKEQYHKFDIPYNNKYRRRVRNKLRNRARMENEAAMNGDDDMDDMDQVHINCLGDVYQTEQDINTWGLEDWSREDEDKISSEAFEWLRLDADFEWICTMQIGQPDYMYQSQLQQDRDVVAQVESLQYFSSITPTPILPTILFRTVMDERYFYGIRQMAARALARCAVPEIDMRGERILLDMFKFRYCFPSSDFIPRENDFSNFAEYYVRGAILDALQAIRVRGKSLPAVRKLLLQQLRHNDNAGNAYDDVHYICTLLETLTSALINTGPVRNEYDEHFEKTISLSLIEIERCQRMDRWQPSYQNLITRTVIKCKERLMQAGCISLSLKELMDLTRETHYVLVRLSAFESLLRLGALRHAPLTKYIFYTLLNDPSPHVIYELGKSIKHGIGAIALLSRQVTTQTDDSMVIEDDTTAAVELRKDREARQTIDGAVAALREDIADDETLKTSIWAALNNYTIDPLTRRNLLNVTKLLYESKQSRILKFKIPGMKARLMCVKLGNGKVVIKKVKPMERYLKKPALKIKLKIK